MIPLKVIEKYEQFNKQGELVCVNWYVKVEGYVVLSTLPLTLVQVFQEKLFPEHSDLSLLSKDEMEALFNTFNAFTAENCDRLKELFPECNPIEEEMGLIEYITDFLKRWTHKDISILNYHTNPTNFQLLQYDMYGLLVLGFELMGCVNSSNIYQFISRTEFEQTFQDMKQINCYLDHYQLLNCPDVRFLKMLSEEGNYLMPIINNKPVFIFIEKKEPYVDAA